MLFFLAILAAVALTNGWPRMSHGLWRYVAAACLCVVIYLLALITFNVVFGYSPDLFGIRASNDIVQFRADVWIGLLAAGLVASIGIELVAYILTGKWSNSFLGRLTIAGFASVILTFITNLPAHQYWSFMGVLLPVGEALFCWLVGMQIWRTATTHIDTTTTT